MRKIVVAAALAGLTALAAPAAAQPAPESPAEAPPADARCRIVIATAPDAARNVVETFLGTEPDCATSLDVEILPIPDGLQVIARDSHGFVRQRLVPDAATAAVLISSWAADDSLGVAAPPALAPMARAPAAPGRPAATSAMLVQALGAPGPAPTRWIGLGLIDAVGDAGGGNGGGIRGEVDVAARGRYSVGVAASFAQSNLPLVAAGVDSSDFGNYIEMIDIKGIVYVAATAHHGPFGVRAEVGGGAVLSHATVVMLQSAPTQFAPTGPTVNDGQGAFRTAEASLITSYELGDSWAVAAGPLLTYFHEDFTPLVQGGSLQTFSRDALEVTLYASVRHRL